MVYQTHSIWILSFTILIAVFYYRLPNKYSRVLHEVKYHSFIPWNNENIRQVRSFTCNDAFACLHNFCEARRLEGPIMVQIFVLTERVFRPGSVFQVMILMFFSCSRNVTGPLCYYM
ncbi:uncharacterized protein LOC123322617 [Coccinella septempunctata]|uniref:uncharacterized protein LOC123322617 n=1 Tax=Coccinella septempunctata TaxID=41139 RepID=UPI001D080D82|nr:uncharacterized protein LOC123322617 [Coccinella septempunctata]